MHYLPPAGSYPEPLPPVARVWRVVEQVVAIHDDLLAQFGGSPGVCDRGALEAAVMRAQMGYYGLLQEAAAMLESLAMNHPFVDGNSGPRSAPPMRFSA